MLKFNHQQLTSWASLESTLQSDHHTRRWFEYLLFETAYGKKYAQNSEEKDRYVGASRKSMYIRILSAISLLCLAGCVLVEANTIAYLLTTIPIGFAILVNSSLKKDMIYLSMHILKGNFREDHLKTMTMFQLGEELARRYECPSLVDGITSVDSYLRRTVLYTIIFTSVIVPQNVWIIWTAVALVFIALRILLRSRILYQNILK